MIKTKEYSEIINLEKVEISKMLKQVRNSKMPTCLNRGMVVIEMLIPSWARVTSIATLTIKLI